VLLYTSYAYVCMRTYVYIYVYTCVCTYECIHVNECVQGSTGCIMYLCEVTDLGRKQHNCLSKSKYVSIDLWTSIYRCRSQMRARS